MFRKKSADESGLVRAHVEIKRLDRVKRKVKIVIVSLDSGATVFKSTYETTAKTEFFTFNVASEFVKSYIEGEDLILQDKITTNIELPGVVTTTKKSR